MMKTTEAVDYPLMKPGYARNLRAANGTVIKDLIGMFTFWVRTVLLAPAPSAAEPPRGARWQHARQRCLPVPVWLGTCARVI